MHGSTVPSAPRHFVPSRRLVLGTAFILVFILGVGVVTVVHFVWSGRAAKRATPKTPPVDMGHEHAAAPA